VHGFQRKSNSCRSTLALLIQALKDFHVNAHCANEPGNFDGKQ
jgi:hypothetical protein